MASRALLRLVHSVPSDGHPEWCARAHHCTAMSMPAGEHVSVPEVWVTDRSRIVGTRHLRRDGSDFVEIRHVVPVHGTEEQRQLMMQELMAGANWALSTVASWHDEPDEG